MAYAQHDMVYTVLAQQPQLVPEERLTIDFHEGFRDSPGQGAQARGKSTCQNGDGQHSVRSFYRTGCVDVSNAEYYEFLCVAADPAIPASLRSDFPLPYPAGISRAQPWPVC